MLTPKQEKYVQGLVSGLSQRKAYKKAYDCKRWKDRTIDNKACALFRNSEVLARYNELIEKANKKVEITAENILKELQAIAFSNGTDYVTINDSGYTIIKPTDEMTERQKKAILSIEDTKFGTKIKTHDKLKAIELLVEYSKVFEKQKEKSEPPTININIVDNSNLKEVMKEGRD